MTIWTTKGFWVNTLTGIAAILALPQVSGLIPPKGVPYVMAAQAIIAVVMRRFATVPVTFMSPKDVV